MEKNTTKFLKELEELRLDKVESKNYINAYN